MASKDDSVPVNPSEIGLDRATINENGQIQLPRPRSPDTSCHDPHGREADNHPEHGSTRASSARVLGLGGEQRHETMAKLKSTLQHPRTHSADIDSKAPVLADSTGEETGSRLVRGLPAPEKPTFQSFLHNPIKTAKSKLSKRGNQQAAAQIAAKEVPHGQEVDLVNASTAVERATTADEKQSAVQELSSLMEARQRTYVRWTLDRHISKVRVLPRDTFARKPRKEFETKGAEGGVEVDWKAYGHHLLLFFAQRYGGEYIGYGSDPPPASKESIMPNIERLLVASSPFQELIMTVRRVYRWENRAETAKYLLIYLTLWYLNLLLPGVLAATIYWVIERRVHGNTVEDLRNDIEHREAVHMTALSLTEYIVKMGDEKWADSLLEGLGPWAMIQLTDMANMFESVRNCYEWRVPTRTMVTLAIGVVAVLVTALTPAWLLMKSATLGAGILFFGCFPIATNFPEYRLLVSPMKRILWKIPTHAEWAIKYVQAEGTRYAEEQAPPSLPPSPSEAPHPGALRDYGFYTAHHEGQRGRLVLSASSVRFVSDFVHKAHWALLYSEINNLEKQDRIVAKHVPKAKTDSGKDLRLVSKTGEEWILENVDIRDQAFSQIIGFSKTTWQVVW